MTIIFAEHNYARATGQDANSLLFDTDSFIRFTMPNDSDMSRLYPPEDYDLRLRQGSAAIDRGFILPGITDQFAGSAPDLGAYEFGSELPQYGPRD